MNADCLAKNSAVLWTAQHRLVAKREAPGSSINHSLIVRFGLDRVNWACKLPPHSGLKIENRWSVFRELLTLLFSLIPALVGEGRMNSDPMCSMEGRQL